MPPPDKNNPTTTTTTTATTSSFPPHPHPQHTATSHSHSPSPSHSNPQYNSPSLSLLWAHHLRREHIHLVDRLDTAQADLVATTKSLARGVDELRDRIGVVGRESEEGLRALEERVSVLDQKMNAVDGKVKNCLERAGSAITNATATGTGFEGLRDRVGELEGIVRGLVAEMVKVREKEKEREREETTVPDSMPLDAVDFRGGKKRNACGVGDADAGAGADACGVRVHACSDGDADGETTCSWMSSTGRVEGGEVEVGAGAGVGGIENGTGSRSIREEQAAGQEKGDDAMRQSPGFNGIVKRKKRRRWIPIVPADEEDLLEMERMAMQVGYKIDR